MKLRVSVMCIGLYFVVGVAISGQSSPPPTSLKWYAQLAKQRGQNVLSFTSSGTHDYTPPLSETLKHSMVVRGRVLAHSTDTSDGYKIRQWYRIKIISSGPSRAPEVRPHVEVQRPSSIGAPASREAILYTDGGTATIDGVAISQPGPALLDVGNTYLFFLIPHEHDTYTLGFNTRPILLDDGGALKLPSKDSSRFSRQMHSFRAYSEVEEASTKAK